MNPQLEQWLKDIDDGKAVPRSTLSQVIRELRAEVSELREELRYGSTAQQCIDEDAPE